MVFLPCSPRAKTHAISGADATLKNASVNLSGVCISIASAQDDNSNSNA
jgi:hypothetical protein